MPPVDSEDKDKFSLESIEKIQHPTPYFLLDLKKIEKALQLYTDNLPPGTEVCYALKANSEESVLNVLKDAGASFEAASIHELEMLKKIGVSPEKILYGTAVKPASAIAEFAKYGVDRFAFDSEDELKKIASNAPGARVYLRVLVADEADSVFTMSEKFGTETEEAVSLMLKTKNYDVIPYGISFNVGSQARNKDAWANGIRDISNVLKKLQEQDLRLEMINLGGGFPFAYQTNDNIPAISDIGEAIKEANGNLPYPVKFLAEPGRGIVADSFVFVASVFAKSRRSNGTWIYIDGGAYNALLETMPYQGLLSYKIEMVRKSDAPKETYIITGPTGDSLDVIGKSVLLPNDVTIGDKIVVRDTGAYSLVLTTPFNGFPKPPVYVLD